VIYPGQVLYIPAYIYTVKSGDTLTRIANRYGITLTALRTANHISGSLIKIGRKLIIPGYDATGKKIITSTGSNSGTGTAAGSSSTSGTSTTAGGSGTSGTTATSGTGTVIPYKSSEVDLLARLIEAEASGESYQAKVAVGGVVVNRIQSNEWAPTITDVIYQKYNSYYQFTPVQNGMINKPASSDSIKAAWAALYGSDPSNGAIFYYDNTTTNQWILSKTVTAHIDNMTFVK
jgi:spore germination cell wall hydrolase CwlJ-like protein